MAKYMVVYRKISFVNFDVEAESIEDAWHQGDELLARGEGMDENTTTHQWGIQSIERTKEIEREDARRTA